jgi:hypothetical protein
VTHEQLYSRLRAEILARHFSLNRYTRADHFDLEAFLGDQKTVAADDDNACAGGISWSIPRTGRNVPLYQDAIDLRKQLGRKRASQVERWRWAKHDRTNALLQTGFRLVSLCIDARAGDQIAWQVIERVLNTLHALLRFKGGPDPYRGYVVRWDVVSSDLWELKPPPSGSPKPPKLIQNFEFLLNPDTKTFSGGDHYMYCTPLNDPRHREAIRLHDGQRGGDRFRRWEPSMDEYVGLVIGYFMIWHTFGNHAASIRGQLAPAARQRADAMVDRVKQHCRWIGEYLKKTGYYIVRPCGGFALRGAFGVNPVLEYPFARAFSRITGDPINNFFPAHDATFERAIEMAGYGGAYRDFGVNPVAAGQSIESIMNANHLWPTDATQQNLLRAALAMPVVALTVVAQNLLKAAAFMPKLQLVGDTTELMGEGAMNYLFNSIARNHGTPGTVGEGSKALFETIFPLFHTDGSSTEFAALLALTSLDDTETSVRDAYLSWYARLRQAGDFNPPSEIEPGDTKQGYTIAANAVRFILGPNSARAAELETQLDQMREKLETVHHGRPPIGDYRQPGGPEPAVAEHHDSARIMFGYMLPLSIVWLHHLRGGAPAVANVPAPTAASIAQQWPDAAVPREVIDAPFMFPRRWIQRGRLNPNQDQYQLFKDPPDRPVDGDLGPPPAPQTVAGNEFPVPSNGFLNDGFPNPFAGSRVEVRGAIPPAPAGLDTSRYFAVASMEPTDQRNVEFPECYAENGQWVVKVQFKPRTIIPPDVDERKFRAIVKITWMRHVD